MGQIRLLNSLPIPALLIALAIQGATPDAHDLASSMALRLLYSTSQGIPVTEDNDGLPDDVCDIIRSRIAPITHESERLHASMHAVLPSFNPPEDWGISARASNLREWLVEVDGLAPLICRLRC